MPKLTEVSLDTIAGGRASVVFDALLKDLLENLRDPNTDPEAARSITLEFKVKPLRSREEAQVILVPKLKLAPIAPSAGHMFLRHGRDGTLATTHDTHQEELELAESEEQLAGSIGD